MIPASIFVISGLALLQFFLSYSQSLIAESRDYELSEQTRQISGVRSRTERGDQFARLLQLLAMCPESAGDSYQVRVVSIYFNMLGFMRVLSTWAFPAAAQWIERERGGCTYAAAVMLDRRITNNRMLKTQQAGIQF